MNPKNFKFLVTGSHGQIGKGLIPKLLNKFGKNSVIGTDMKQKCEIPNCNYVTLDVRDKTKFEEIVKAEKVNYIVHLAGIISVLAEKNPILAREVNVDSVFTSLDLSVKYNTKLFIPSTVMVYAGDEIDRQSVTLKTVPEPRTFYGVCKVFMENLGVYYTNKHNIDFRCLRYSAVVSPYEYDYNGTFFYATEIFFKAVREKFYAVNMLPQRTVPFSHLEDIIDGTIQILDAEKSKLTKNVYNIAGLSFSPEDLVREIKKHIPNFKVEYQQKINDLLASKTPHYMDDSDSRKDFGWNPKYDKIEKIVKDMIEIANNTESLKRSKITI